MGKAGSCQLCLLPVCAASWQVTSTPGTELGNVPIRRQPKSLAWKTCKVYKPEVLRQQQLSVLLKQS